MDSRAWLFVVLAGLSGAISWLAYFAALRLGVASKISALDRLSVAFIFVLSLFFIIANPRQAGDEREYFLKEKEAREDNHIPAGDRILFLEVEVCDASEFTDVLEVKGVDVHGYKVLRAQSSTVPNAIAAFLLYLRDMTGQIPHFYFSWSEGNPIQYLFRYIVFGEGDTTPVTHEVLRQAEEDPERRPTIHVGG